ncbi:MAG: response regulator transcription factor [Candidatus Obscuribacterales bacterium]|nr:response regulator transcription factor [Candidatus Obscuribacterales bacterium]
MAKILLVEDEPDLATLMAGWLTQHEHDVEILSNGEVAFERIKSQNQDYELLILDLMLPGKNGIEICQEYRRNAGSAPVLIVTARNGIASKEQAFEQGADDYVTKPFHLKELAARVSALLRRGNLPLNTVIRVRDIILDVNECKVTKSGKSVHLTPQEFHLLEFFFKNPNRVFSAKELLAKAWGQADDLMEDTVRGHIKRIRRKLDSKNANSLIVNVYGFGYKLESSNRTTEA